jgi:hypothetical protein
MLLSPAVLCEVENIPDIIRGANPKIIYIIAMSIIADYWSVPFSTYCFGFDDHLVNRAVLAAGAAHFTFGWIDHIAVIHPIDRPIFAKGGAGTALDAFFRNDVGHRIFLSGFL